MDTTSSQENQNPIPSQDQAETQDKEGQQTPGTRKRSRLSQLATIGNLIQANSLLDSINRAGRLADASARESFKDAWKEEEDMQVEFNLDSPRIEHHHHPAPATQPESGMSTVVKAAALLALGAGGAAAVPYLVDAIRGQEVKPPPAQSVPIDREYEGGFWRENK